MAKEKEKRIGFDYYVNQGKTAKEIAGIINVSEKTLGNWISAGKWKSARDAKMNGTKALTQNIKEFISELNDDQLFINTEIKAAKAVGDEKKVAELRRQSSAISQEVAIQTKALDKLDSENKVTLSVYLEVMADIFESMQATDPKLYQASLDFQEQHLNTTTLKLG